MIGITTSSIIVNNTFKGVNYNKDTRKHAILFESISGDVCIVFERDEFANFMTEIVESWSKASKHLINEAVKEIIQ